MHPLTDKQVQPFRATPAPLLSTSLTMVARIEPGSKGISPELATASQGNSRSPELIVLEAAWETDMVGPFETLHGPGRDGRRLMALERAVLIALRGRVEALQAVPCGMAHESIPVGSDGDPMRSARSPSGFARTGLCLEVERATNLGCSHTMARYVLRDALLQVPGDGNEAVLAAVHELEQAISLLDHRRYDAESRKANARLAKADGAPAEREIAALVAEHRARVRRAGELRDDVLRRIDDALGR
jgi:hypothetical protein